MVKVVFFLSIFFYVPFLFAGPADMYGLSSKSTGISILSATSDPFWTYQNPSFLTKAQKLQTSLGLMGTADFFKPIEKVVTQNDASGKSIEIGNIKTDYSNLGGINLGLILPLSSRFVTGVCGFIPFGSLASVNTSEPYVPVYGLYYNNPKRFSFIGGGAFKISEYFSVGVAANIYLTSAATTYMNLNNENPSVSIAMDIYPAISPVVGARYQNNDWDVDLSYHSEVNYLMTLENKTDLVMFGESSFPVIEFLATSSIFYDPLMVGLGISKMFQNGLKLGTRLQWKNWKPYQSPLNRVNFVNPGDLEARLPDIRFKNVLSPSLGVEFPWRSFLLRAGYRYEPEHVSYQEEDSNFLDTDVHVVSTGVGYSFPFIDVDFHLQGHELRSKKITKENPFSVGYREDGFTIGGFLLNYGITLTKTF